MLCESFFNVTTATSCRFNMREVIFANYQIKKMFKKFKKKSRTPNSLNLGFEPINIVILNYTIDNFEYLA